jgi:PhnB protein
MSDQVNPIPEGYHTVTPYLILQDAAQALEFYKKAFSAIEIVRMANPDGKVGHAEIKIGNSMLMLGEETLEMGYRGVQSYGGSPISIMLYVEDCDALFNQAVAAGAEVKQALKDQFYGDRSGMIADPFGFQWHLSTHKEDVTPEDMKKRMAAAMGDCGATAS